MRPGNLKTKIFLDSGNPADTRKAIDMLGFLDGQTTNPSLFAKNPEVKARIDAGNKFTKEEVYAEYKKVVQEVRAVLPNESISIEVYGDANTQAEEMIEWGREMNTWISNAQIKLPTIEAGLVAAQTLTSEGINVNMTLVFSEEQAAAVYAATADRKEGTTVFLSPFIGRLDDIHQNGANLIENILQTYNDKGDDHVEVLGASIRSLDHLLEMFALECDIVTVPFKILREWVDSGMQVPGDDFVYAPAELTTMPYQDISLDEDIHSYNLQHELTDKGLAQFAADWNALVQ